MGRKWRTFRSYFDLSFGQFDGLDDVAREEQLDQPIAQHSNLALQAGQFSQINATPQQPGKQSAEAYGLPAREGNRQFGASRVMPDHAQRAQRIEVKWFRRAVSQNSANIPGQHAGLTQCELRSGRTWIPRLAILERGAIAHGPQSGMAGHSHRAVDHHGAPAIGLYGQCPQQRIWRGPRGPDQRSRPNFTVAQDHAAGPAIAQPAVEPERDAAHRHALLRIPPSDSLSSGKMRSRA